MGIMIAYGSYVSDDSNLAKSVNQIEIFDTAVAFLAGVMIIPAVYVFMGKEGMQAPGPSLMFVTLPRVFKSMGWIGNIIGALFFFMVFFAALSSAISIMEAVVSSFMDQFKTSRVKATTIETVLAAVVGIVVCLGYNIWYFEVNLGSVKGGQILDLLDYVSNNVLMPISAIGTCLLIGWIVKPKTVIDEVEKNGEKMGRKILYKVMIKFIAPILLIIILLKSFNIDVIDLVEKLF
jgi:NSS family neurotransmitter:Na+ symporter